MSSRMGRTQEMALEEARAIREVKRAEVRRRAMRYRDAYLSGDATVEDIARTLRIGEQTLRDWWRQAEQAEKGTP